MSNEIRFECVYEKFYLTKHQIDYIYVKKGKDVWKTTNYCHSTFFISWIILAVFKAKKFKIMLSVYPYIFYV